MGLKQDQTNMRVKLLTYNFFIRPPPFSTGGEDWKTERLHYFIKTYLQQYDIICF